VFHYSSVSFRYTVMSCRSDFSSTTCRQPTRSRWSVTVLTLLSLLSRRRCSGCSFHSVLPLFWRLSSWECWWTRGCSCSSGGRWWGKRTGCCKDLSSNWVLVDWGQHFRDSWKIEKNTIKWVLWNVFLSKFFEKAFWNSVKLQHKFTWQLKLTWYVDPRGIGVRRTCNRPWRISLRPTIQNRIRRGGMPRRSWSRPWWRSCQRIVPPWLVEPANLEIGI